MKLKFNWAFNMPKVLFALNNAALAFIGAAAYHSMQMGKSANFFLYVSLGVVLTIFDYNVLSDED